MATSADQSEVELAVGVVVDAALTVHSALGPGLLENAYQACLAHELIQRRIDVRQQVPLPFTYDGVDLDMGYRIDLLVAESIVVELKAVERVLPLHIAQLLSYLRLGRYRIGLLINFHTVHLRDGIKRLVNGFEPR